MARLLKRMIKARKPFPYMVGALNILQSSVIGVGHINRVAVIYHNRMMSLFDRETNFERERSYRFTLSEGFFYTFEGNKSPNVQGFNYVLSRVDKLLGFGQVLDA